VLTGVAAYALFDLSWLESVLLGAVVASTDAAAVFATLRFTHIRRRLARTLEAETGGNDPVAIALTLGLIDWIEKPSFGFADLVLLVVRQLGLGLVVGVGLGAVAVWLFARLPHSIGAFAPVASVATGALSFGVADVIGAAASLPSTWSVSPSAAPPRATGASWSPSTRVSRSSHRWRCSSCSACSFSRAICRRWRCQAWCWRRCSWW
jgi:hypothetical protein